MLVIEPPTPTFRFSSNNFDRSPRRISHSVVSFNTRNKCRKSMRKSCAGGYGIRASAKEQSGSGNYKQNAKPQRYHPFEDVSESESDENGESRLTPAETTRTVIEVNSKATLMFSGLINEEVHENIFWPDLPYVTDEHGNIYFQVKNDQDILQTLSAGENLVQVIIGLDTAEMLREMEELGHTELDFDIDELDEEDGDEEDDDDDEEGDSEDEEEDGEDWITIVDNEEDQDDDSDGSLGDWAKLDTMRSSHPMYFARKISEAVRLSSRKKDDGVAPFLQLPHFTDSVVENLSKKKIKTFKEFQDMNTQERTTLLNELGISSTKALDIQKVLDIMPCTSIEATCQTEGEEGIQEDDVVTLQAWVTLQRGNGLIRALPHTPHYPFHKEENFWFLLADDKTKNVWFSKKVSFNDESAAITAASRAIMHKMEMMEASTEETNAAVKDAVNKVKNGSRLVLGKFLAPKAGTYDLRCYLMCDTWIGCDIITELPMKVVKQNKVAPRIEEARVEDDGSDEEDETDEEDEYESEYSEDDGEDSEEEDEVIEKETAKKETKKGMANGKGKQAKNTKVVSNQNRKKRR